jgi:hypothetical protein
MWPFESIHSGRTISWYSTTGLLVMLRCTLLAKVGLVKPVSGHGRVSLLLRAAGSVKLLP